MTLPTRTTTRVFGAALAGLAGLAGLALAATLAGPAAAETQVRTDPRGDAVEVPDTRSASATAPSPAARREGTEDTEDTADIVELRATYDDDRLTFAFTLADLVISPERDSAVYARFTTPGGRDWTASLVRSDGGYKSLDLVDNATQETVTCEGLSGRSNLATDRMVVSVPRSCVKRPRSVRFGGTAYGLDIYAPVGYIERIYADDARLDGRVEGTTRVGTRDLAYGAHRRIG